MLRGNVSQRIFLIQGPSDCGKTVLLARLAEHATAILGVGTCARANLRGEPPLDVVLERICNDLGRTYFPTFCGSAGLAPVSIHAELPQAQFGDGNVFSIQSHVYQSGRSDQASRLIADLASRGGPAVIIIDTFEGATVESARWVVQELLPMVRITSRLWIVIAGQAIPKTADHYVEWGDLAESHNLSSVSSTEEWHEFACRSYPNFPRHYIDVVFDGLSSRPSAIEEFIRVAGSKLLASDQDPMP